ncbi:DEAD/DEAH box helicase, putative [Plasmodium gallinaceum]|uniref:Copper transport protein n=1 Tax=Plasmodium gallinaceum TaxID=5849 RepID=A0A1J1GU73_PLAGA|nr:DEAD/DEAH box helicase, putative [Plasmodium gallinaceum]CRG94585.1 DEAD/DEAH box helicase, putative [Plasmodium gallinaceum]
MNKYLASVLFIILILNSIDINAGSTNSKNNCTPDFTISCSHKCCKKKLAFIQECWDNYKKYSEIINEHKRNENNIIYSLEENMDLMGKGESMPMSFQFSTHTIILFKSWETLSKGSYYISLVVCFFFGLISVMLKVFRLNIERSLPKTKDRNVFKSETLFKNNTIRMILAFIIYSWDYLLMLIVMTFNVGLFFSVIFGLAFGFFLFGSHFVTSKKCATTDLDIHKQFYGDPACCGC